MSYLLAAVSVLSIVNLALLLAVIRRMREHGARLATLPKFRAPLTRLPAGTPIPEFTAVTVTGESRSLADMAGSRSLVGFFSPGCGPCHDQLPEFARFAKAIPGGARQVLAVLTGPEKQSAEFASGLNGEASVVIEPPHGTLATAFSVPGFPSFYLVGADGLIEASGMAMDMIAPSLASA